MNFAQAANEVVNWVSVHPLGTFAIVAGAILGTREAVSQYKAHKANRAKVEEILRSAPVVKPLNLPHSPR